MPNTRPKKPGTRCVGAFCAVYGCSNYQGKTKLLGLSYHSFPRDPELRKIWIRKCRRADKWNPAKSHICADHFRPDDFRRDLKAELMQCRKINQLKHGTVPSRNLPMVRAKESTSNVSKTRRFGKLMDSTQDEDGKGSDAPNETSIVCFEFSTTEVSSQHPSLTEAPTETIMSDRLCYRVVHSEVLLSENSETELEDEDFFLKTDIERLKHLVEEKDNEISDLERALSRRKKNG